MLITPDVGGTLIGGWSGSAEHERAAAAIARNSSASAAALSLVEPKTSKCHAVRLPRAAGVATVCCVQAGTRYRHDDLDLAPDALADKLARGGAISRGDALVLNDGLWFQDEAPARLRAVATRLAARPAWLRDASVVWREVTPQAFPGDARGAHTIGRDINATACARVQKPERQAARELALRELARGADIELALVWGMAVTQWDTHLALRSEHVVQRGLDCTHLCEPSGVLEAMVDATALAVLRADAKRAKARAARDSRERPKSTPKGLAPNKTA